ncbi:MAG TPA: cobalt transport protein CbiN [Methanoregulaceae archaeon]|nr:cobalt transport protein CbiN [Methanoregulaceae archaeon]
MIRDRKLELITAVAVLAFVIVFLVVSSGGTHAFSGSDDVGSEKVAELTGHPVDSFKPLIPQYEPPSGEIEATLFALQAAFGGILLGFVFGYWLGQKKQMPTS